MKEKLMSLATTLSMSMMTANMVLANGKVDLTPTTPTDDMLTKIANPVLGAIQTIGYIVAVVMIMYIGIKYLMAGAGEKAKVKETMVPMLAGAILIVAAVNIVSWVWGIAGGANP